MSRSVRRTTLALMLWEIERNQSRERKASLGPLKYGKGKDKWTIEHVMPQHIVNPKPGKTKGRLGKEEQIIGLSQQWQTDLTKWGIADPFNHYRRYKHCLANLTLAIGGDNSFYSNMPFDKKKHEYRKKSSLLITLSSICDKEKWDAATLRDRGLWLIDEICRRWPLPWEIE